jgi:short subunit dehydrogenase-like uncharacterized protein
VEKSCLSLSLIADDLVKIGRISKRPSRRAGPIEVLAEDLGLPARVFDLGDPRAAAAALADMAVVSYCAGPFSATSAQMIDACFASRTHYVDITGELDVFVAAQRRHADAQAAGIVICPGMGFDVIPTDCLAAVLKQALPDAEHLVLAFDARTHVSPGTARTMVESFRHGRRGGKVRRNGVIEEVPLAHSRRRVDFTGGSAMTVAIAWGDLATAYVSTGIPNTETYASMPSAAAIAGRALNWARPVLASAPVQKVLRRLADRSTGPSLKRSYARGDPASGARSATRRESAARHGWRPPMATV